MKNIPKVGSELKMEFVSKKGIDINVRLNALIRGISYMELQKKHVTSRLIPTRYYREIRGGHLRIAITTSILTVLLLPF
jgi:hypothetical protein